MPKKKYKDHLHKSSGEYSNYEFYDQTLMMRMDMDEFLLGNNPKLAEKYKKALEEFQQSVVLEDVPKETKLASKSLNSIRFSGGDPEKINAFYEVLDEVKEYTDNFLDNLEGPQKNFKEFYKLEFTHTNYNRNYGSFISAQHDNSVLSSLQIIAGTGPYMPIDKVQSGTFDYAKLEADLRKPDGKGYFVPYMNICKAANDLWALEFEKQKKDIFGWTPKSRKAHLDKYKKALQDFTKGFDNLMEVTKNYGDLYKKGVHLNNVADEMTGTQGNQRAIDYLNDHIKGQIKAIENGWDLDEVTLLGQISEIPGRVDKKIKNNNKAIEETKNALEKQKKELKELRDTVASLERESYSDNTDYKIRQFKTLNGKLIDWHKEYEEQARYLENHYMTEELEAYKAENAEKLEQWKDYQETLSAFRLESEIINAKKQLENKVKEIAETEKKQQQLEEIGKNLVKIKDDSIKLKEKAFNTKVRNLNDKKMVLQEYENYYVGVKDLSVDLKSKYGGKTSSLDANVELIQDIKDKLYSGQDMAIKNNKFAARQNQYDLDIYGPNPHYHEVWEESQVIEKKVFEEYIKPFDTKVRNNLPFTDTEITYINMAATLNARDAIKADFENTPYRLFDPEQISNKQFSNWMEDFSSRETGPKEKVGDFRNIIKAGREKGLNAMQEYTKGNKVLLAEMIHKSLTLQQKNYDIISTISFNTPHHYANITALTGLLQKDPELYKEFNKINAKQAPKKRVNLEKLNQIKSVAKIAMDSINDNNQLKEFEKTYADNVSQWENIWGKDNEMYKAQVNDANEKRQRLELGAMRGILINEITNSASMYKEATSEMNSFLKQIGSPEGLKDFDNFIDEMVEKYGMTINPESGSLEIKGKSASSTQEYRYECEKYMLECEQKAILQKISNEKLPVKDRNELIANYMINNRQINELDQGIWTGEVSSFANKTEREAPLNLEKNKLYIDYINRYIPSMDLDGLSNAEIVDVLKNGGHTLNEICENIEHVCDIDLYQKQLKENPLTAKAVDLTDGQIEDALAIKDIIVEGEANRNAAKEAAKKAVKEEKKPEKEEKKPEKEEKKPEKELNAEEALQKAMDAEVARRNTFTKEVNLDNYQAIINRIKIEGLYDSVKKTLYLQTLKDSLTPTEKDNKAQASVKNRKIIDKVNSGMTRDESKKMDKLLQTRFGNALKKAVLNRALDPKENSKLSQNDIIELRDQTLRKVFMEVNDKANPNRRADLKNIFEIGESLGSNALSEKYTKFKEAQAASAKKKLEKELSTKKLEDKNAGQLRIAGRNS